MPSSRPAADRARGTYLTRGRGLELERQIEAVRRELGERVAAAEARATAAEQTTQKIYDALVGALAKPNRKAA